MTQEEVFESFKEEIKEQIDSVRGDVRNLNADKKKFENFFISSQRSLNLKKQQIKDLTKFSSNVNLTIKEQIKEIKKLPFVKRVCFREEGINIDVGKVDINYRGNDVYIGDFTIIITSKGIDIKNRKPIRMTDCYDDKHIYEHPHIDDDGEICYGGERHIKISEHFAKFQLKQLVYMVYLFLKTYSERDKYNSISHWTQEAKRKEREQKVVIENE